jgi:hypothetical protein
MPKAEYTLTDVMLTHAAITYRGFALVLPEDRARLRATMAECLHTLGPVKNQWDIVWGPASFRSKLSAFDDAAMYVARSRTQPSRFVVAVRGTNPVSLFDWVFGDLLTSRQVPWPYGTGPGVKDARISFSTALGLSILQHLRWEPLAPTVTTGLTTSIFERIRGELGGVATALLRHLETDVSEPLRRVSSALQTKLATLSAIATQLATAPADRVVQLIRERRASQSARDTLQLLDEAFDHLRETRIDPLRLLLGGSEVRRLFASGVGLQSFLRAAVQESGAGTEIYVTGHSKGGALSSTLALWLADTQGRDVAKDDQWDPDRKATVHAYSFAGPTAGNGAFVRHSNAVIGPRCHRIANNLDVVPHAWARTDLEAIATLYPSPVLPIPFLGQFIGELAREDAPLDYQHVGNDVTALPGDLNRRKLLFLDQMIYQHLDGYFEQMKLAGEMNTATFFNPLS